MIEFARGTVPALLAIVYLGSSMIPCPLVAASSERVGGDRPGVALEDGREVPSYADHHDAVAEVDTLIAPCPCGCGDGAGDSSVAKRLGTAVIVEVCCESSPAEGVRPLVFAAALPDGPRQVPDPIPIPS